MFEAAPVFFDCEASSLDGYIIEIGWAFVESSGAITSASHLIRPPWNWKIADAWSTKAEKMHGISLAQVRATGDWPENVARRMNEQLAGRELYSDSPYDENWLGQLFEAVGVQPEFTVRRTLAPTVLERIAIERNFDLARLTKMRAEAEGNRRHRAEEDALLWARLWKAVAFGG